MFSIQNPLLRENDSISASTCIGHRFAASPRCAALASSHLLAIYTAAAFLLATPYKIRSASCVCCSGSKVRSQSIPNTCMPSLYKDIASLRILAKIASFFIRGVFYKNNAKKRKSPFRKIRFFNVLIILKYLSPSMQPAFPVFGIFPPPAARANVLARLDGAGARLAAD